MTRPRPDIDLDQLAALDTGQRDAVIAELAWQHLVNRHHLIEALADCLGPPRPHDVNPGVTDQ